MKNLLIERRLSADEAFQHLYQLYEFAECNDVQLSPEQKAYCEEWLFDCVHETGDCPFKTPLEIFNASFDEFREEN